MNDVTKLPALKENVPLAKIKLGDETQTRSGVNLAHVADLKDALDSGVEFDRPVDLFRDDDDRYWIGDGFHRCYAAKGAGREKIAALVRPGSQRTALLFGIGANQKHGLKRTNADKKRCVELALADVELGKLSDREIARHCGVHHDTVSTIRSGQLSDSDSSNPSTPDANKRVCSDGKTRDVSKIGKRRCPKCNCVVNTKGEKYCDACRGKGLAADLTRPRKPLNCQPNLPITDRDEPEPRRSARLPKEKPAATQAVAGSATDVSASPRTEADRSGSDFDLEQSEARVRDLIYAERAKWPAEYMDRFSDLIGEISVAIAMES